MADLDDKFGSYGTVGVAIIDFSRSSWRLIFLAISCRTMGRGIERAFLLHLISMAKNEGLEFVEAAYRATGKNKMMRSMYQMMGFRQWNISEKDATIIFRLHTNETPNIPPWIDVI